ncbi:MAG: cupin domain-containing protein [bacterium]
MHFHADQAAWGGTRTYPDWLRKIYRVRSLVGFGGVPCADAAMGLLELDPGTYPFHAHPAPEIYFVVSGQAEWTVGEDTFEAVPGTAIYHPPGARHQMVNRGPETLKTVWFWWAPEGRTEVLDVPSRLLVE